MFEKTNNVARVFEFVDIRPNFGLPRLLMRCRFPASSTPCVKLNGPGGDYPRTRRQFQKHAANLLNFLIRADQKLVAQKETKTQFAGFLLRFQAGVKWPIFGTQLFG